MKSCGVITTDPLRQSHCFCETAQHVALGLYDLPFFCFVNKSTMSTPTASANLSQLAARTFQLAQAILWPAKIIGAKRKAGRRVQTETLREIATG
jgi:hypothetical protein